MMLGWCLGNSGVTLRGMQPKLPVLTRDGVARGVDPGLGFKLVREEFVRIPESVVRDQPLVGTSNSNIRNQILRRGLLSGWM